MKKLSLVILSLLFAAPIICFSTPPKKTIVYIVRHAEKTTTNADDDDPDLNNAGKQRANDLSATLKNEKFDVIFSTKYKRNRQTAAPLAQQYGLPIATYDAHDFKGIAEVIRSNYSGLVAMIIGHSNTVLELVKAFGAKPPIEKLTDDDYDLLFKITIGTNGKSKLKTMRYGKLHHSTILP